VEVEVLELESAVLLLKLLWAAEAMASSVVIPIQMILQVVEVVLVLSLSFPLVL
jgi:hypothetical protein